MVPFKEKRWYIKVYDRHHFFYENFQYEYDKETNVDLSVFERFCLRNSIWNHFFENGSNGIILFPVWINR